MSGVSALLAAIGGQVPVILTRSFVDNSPGLANPIFRFWRDGRATFAKGDGTITVLTPDWGGAQSRSTEGDSYEVRLTLVSGAFGDPEFDPLNVWIPLDDPSNPSAIYVAASPGSSGSAVLKVEIRRETPLLNIVASGNWTVTWSS